MISGLGFFEIIVVLLVVLMFFGSKELPHIVREGARMIAKLRRYSEKVRRELNEVTRVTDISDTIEDENDVNKRKERVRTAYLEKRKELSEEERKDKSSKIAELLYGTDEYKKARAVLMYASTRTEVQTYDSIRDMLSDGKRIVLPYCRPNSTEIGLAEIKNVPDDLQEGQYKMMEPKDELKDNFLKSDIQLAIIPGVTFDKNGGRLGRGKGCYDYFLKEIKTKVPLVGFSFQCQILDDDLPFDYHDVPMDLVITEEGVRRYS